MNRPPPITVREIIKTVDHACQCWKVANQGDMYRQWAAQAGPPQPKDAPPPVLDPPPEK